jgi:predicted GIY-YIG superfamily endonuclease
MRYVRAADGKIRRKREVVGCTCEPPKTSAVHTRPTVLYRLYDVNDQLLYVGVTTRLTTRLNTHAQSKPWFGDVARIETMSFATGCEALEQERHEHRETSPFYSRV